MTYQKILVMSIALFTMIAATSALGQGPHTTLMSCNNGKYLENGKPFPESNYHCEKHPGLSAVALAIDVPHGMYVHSDNPPCKDIAHPDETIKELTRMGAAYATSGESEASFEKLWNALVTKSSSSGGDLSKLINGIIGVPDTSSCQAFILSPPVPVHKLKLIELRAAQGVREDDDYLTTTVSINGVGTSDGKCRINWSAWQGLNISGNAVGAIFKNWSDNRMRTGQMWLWY